MHGARHISLIWIRRRERHLMISHTLVRTGDSLHITGKQWKRIITSGGRVALQRWPTISMHTELIIFWASSVSGRYHWMRFRDFLDILIRSEERRVGKGVDLGGCWM